MFEPKARSSRAQRYQRGSRSAHSEGQAGGVATRIALPKQVNLLISTLLKTNEGGVCVYPYKGYPRKQSRLYKHVYKLARSL